MDNVFESKKSFSLFISMSMPLVIGQLFIMVYNIADTYFISYSQDASLVAGIALCGPIFTIQMAIGNLMGQGGCSLVSRLLGNKDNEGIKRANSFVFYMGIILGCILAVFLLIFKMPMLRLLGADSGTMDAAISYYNIIAAGSPIIVMSFIPVNMIRTEGYAKQSMAGLMIGTAINLVLDPIMILLLGWGAFGAALATVIANTAAVAYVIIFTYKNSKILSMNPKYFRCKRSAILNIFAVGSSAALMNILGAVSAMLLNNALLTYGSDMIAAMGIANKIYYVPFLVIDGFSFGLQPVLGYYYGSGDNKKMRTVIGQAFGFQICLCAAMTIAIALLAPVLVPCFLKDPSIVSAGKQMLTALVIGLTGALFHLQITIIFQSLGKAGAALLLSVMGQGVIFAVSLFTLKALFAFEGVVWAQTCANFAAAVFSVIMGIRQLSCLKSPASHA